MLNFIKRKLAKRKHKRTFREHGYTIKEFTIPPFGTVRYAQWLHPFEKPKSISADHVSFYQKLGSADNFVVDVGAHTGDTTVPMALAAGPSGKVLALEPNRYVFKVLKVNADLNPSHTNIDAQCLAATEEDGPVTFNYSDASFGNGGFLSEIESDKHRHNYMLEVTGKNLQELLTEHHAEDLPRLALIKIDAEGYDKEIIKTITDVLIECRPAVLVECFKYLSAEERTDLYNALDAPGYNLYHLDDFESLDNLRLLGVGDMSIERHFEILALHRERLGEYAFMRA